MGERLVFGYGTDRAGGVTPFRQATPPGGPPQPPRVVTAVPHTEPRRRDWAFTGLIAFTALLFFRPQDTFRVLNPLHLAEMAAIFALLAMAIGRLRRGLPISRVTPELAAVVALGGVILLTAPFSIWPGGAVGTFTELYVKVILIFLLMVNTLLWPRRIEQFTWLIVIATGYIAFRAVFDYARGINLVENGRVMGSVGGIFKNPNDLALNMVSVIPLALGFVLRPLSPLRRLTAAGCAFLMFGTIVASQSRGGTIGLVVAIVVLGLALVRRRPGLVAAGALGVLFMMPFLPQSYWDRMASITDQTKDQTGSRSARAVLLRESYDTFLEHPMTGVGAGQFKNYRPEGRSEAWRESHNAVLQVASELGILGVVVFVFIIVRGMYAPIETRRLLKRSSAGPARRGSVPADWLPAGERDMLLYHAAAMTAAFAGWLTCAMFASVAYNWTLYYLLALAVGPREYLQDRLGVIRPARRRREAPAGVVAEARA